MPQPEVPGEGDISVRVNEAIATFSGESWGQEETGSPYPTQGVFMMDQEQERTATDPNVVSQKMFDHTVEMLLWQLRGQKSIFRNGTVYRVGPLEKNQGGNDFITLTASKKGKDDRKGTLSVGTNFDGEEARTFSAIRGEMLDESMEDFRNDAPISKMDYEGVRAALDWYFQAYPATEAGDESTYDCLRGALRGFSEVEEDGKPSPVRQASFIRGGYVFTITEYEKKIAIHVRKNIHGPMLADVQGEDGEDIAFYNVPLSDLDDYGLHTAYSFLIATGLLAPSPRYERALNLLHGIDGMDITEIRTLLEPYYSTHGITEEKRDHTYSKEAEVKKGDSIFTIREQAGTTEDILPSISISEQVSQGESQCASCIAGEVSPDFLEILKRLLQEEPPPKVTWEGKLEEMECDAIWDLLQSFLKLQPKYRVGETNRGSVWVNKGASAFEISRDEGGTITLKEHPGKKWDTAATNTGRMNSEGTKERVFLAILERLLA